MQLLVAGCWVLGEGGARTEVGATHPPTHPPSQTSRPLHTIPHPITPTHPPVQTAALDPSSSIILPTVIREGKPCGFMIRSGTSPRSEKGMSLCTVGQEAIGLVGRLVGRLVGWLAGWVGFVIRLGTRPCSEEICLSASDKRTVGWKRKLCRQ